MNRIIPTGFNILRASRGQVVFVACLLTLAAGGAQSATFPNVPLESGAQYPPPNVRFILDDSG
jgi:hypothetical protein